jgi:hypothetical protein
MNEIYQEKPLDNYDGIASFKQARANFSQAYADFFALIEHFPQERTDEAGACGYWSAREILAHMAGWLQEAQRRYARYARGTSDIVYDVDNFNAVSVRRRAEHSWDRVAEELRREHDALLNMADELPEVRLERDGRYAEWLQGLADDCHEHIPHLQAYVEA